MDYLAVEPLRAERLRSALSRALEHRRLRFRALTSEETPEQADCGDLVTNDYRMRAVCSTVTAVAASKAILLVCGESGTGKTLVARMLHRRSPRCVGPFVELNCGVLSDTLLESELFGHVRGAFTSAYREHRGKFDLADGGTLLLDDIANATPKLQAKLLRVVESGEYMRLGDAQTLRCDVRLVVATNVSLRERVERGAFREDLYHRLNGVQVKLPPLRDRVGDIPQLARHFVNAFAAQHGRRPKGIAPEAMDRLVHYRWPGNVRELRNAIEHGVILAEDGAVTPQTLPTHIAEAGPSRAPGARRSGAQPLKCAMREPERRLILQALRTSSWNKLHAARTLGISRSTLYKKMKEHGLDPGEADGSTARAAGVWQASRLVSP